MWVKGKVGVCWVEGWVHTVFAGPSSAGLPGMWKERSGKSTPWSEWYILPQSVGSQSGLDTKH